MNTFDELKTPPRPPKMNGGYLFLPHKLSRGAFLKWLRRTHAWFGLWGAMLGLLFGLSGILLNHREIMKIPTGRIPQKEIQLPLPEPHPADAKAMAQWLGQTLEIDTANAKIRNEKEKIVTWNNVPVQQPEQWQITVRNPKFMMQAEYWQGNTFVTVKKGEGSFLNLLTNLHKGVGMGMGWVLLVDTLAGGLIILCLTGTLLWTRLHGTRLAGVSLGFGSLGLMVFFTLQAIGN
ncbi:MAG: PepSY-associated TM helix domain-containing protein [Methylococcaceae bacterium]